MAGLTPPITRRMTAEEFVLWAEAQPHGRYELENGEVLVMPSERARQARVKSAAWAALRDAIGRANLPCEAFPDGMAVRIDERTVYEPDALIRCGERLADDDIIVRDPMIVVEISLPSTARRDGTTKLAGYLLLPSIRHYLIIDLEQEAVIHFSRPGGQSAALTHILREGPIRLDPPGLQLDVAALLDPA